MGTRGHIAIFVAFLTMASCSFYDPVYKPDDYDVNRSEFLSLEPSKKSVAADGFSTVTIHVSLEAQAAREKRVVTLSASAGTFLGGTSPLSLTVDKDGKGVVYLKSENRRNTAIVRATLENVSVQDTIAFTQAYPDSIALDPGSFTLKQGIANETVITARLKRKDGIPSLETPAAFSALDSLKRPIGRFREGTVSNDKGIVTIRFTAGTTSYRGLIYLHAEVDRPEGSVTAVDSIQVTD